MSTILIVLAIAGLLLLVALIAYIVPRAYIARTDRTYMTHNEVGFVRALQGWGVVWSVLESVVKGAQAPRIEYVAIDPATGQRRAAALIDPRTGSINLRPQYCVPLPFIATTSDSHRVVVEARVQFSLNRELMKYVYQLDDFSMALDTRIQSAFRAEIGLRADEVLRGALHEVEENVVARLRQAERDGDEAGEAGLALGVNFHTASLSYTLADDHAEALALSFAHPAPVVASGGETATHGAVAQGGRAAGRTHGVLALRPQQLDLLADVFKGRDPASTQALLAILEMQTRQNIAEALAGSGQLVVVTAQELGLASAAAHNDAVAKSSVRNSEFGRPAEAPSGASPMRQA